MTERVEEFFNLFPQVTEDDQATPNILRHLAPKDF